MSQQARMDSSSDEARAMAEAGTLVLAPHMRLSTSGPIGAQAALSLDWAVAQMQAAMG